MENIIKKIEKEFGAYKKEMFMQEKEELWNRTHKIDFFCCVYEYFLYNNNIPEEIWKGIVGKESVIAGCWEVYLKNERLSVQSWENIECILRKYIGNCNKMEEEKMSFDKFKKDIQGKVKNLLHGGEQVIINEILKNNSVHASGLIIKREESNLSPTIYLEEFYKEFIEGASIDYLAEQIVAFYKKHKVSKKIDISFFKDWQQVKSKIAYKIISKEKNKELLKRVPFEEYLDLAIVFYVKLGKDEGQKGSILIHNEHCKIWKIGQEELVKTAMQNTPLLVPAVCKPIEAFIAELLHLEEEEFPENNLPILVLTNKEQLYGAATILYQGVIESIATKQDSDLYIILSSVHEALIIPEKYYDNSVELKEIVKEVNATQVSNDEVVADTIYYYKRDIDKVILVE